MAAEADFSGYATKAGLKCSDGRTIMPEAFKHMDGQKVPLVWQHGHNDPANVLGHVILEARDDGMYSYAFFNENSGGKNAKALVQHGDIVALSIYANQLVERAKSVFHGTIREVSLVLSGANPGALIDNISLAHGDGDFEKLEDEAIIFTGLGLEHEDLTHADAAADVTVKDVFDSFSPEEKEVVYFMIGDAVEQAKSGSVAQSGLDDTEVVDGTDATEAVVHASDATVKDVFETLSEEQKTVVYYMIGAAIDASQSGSIAQSSDDNAEEGNTTNEGDLKHTEGTVDMTNVFEQNGIAQQERATLTHDQLTTIVQDAQKMGSFKDSFLAHAVEYGIENIDFLFPDARTLASSPEMVTRRQEWVNVVLTGAKKSPFSRIKTISADVTLDAARAKGYVKASLKKEEWFGLQKRVTTPTTIYKKQKLDRDDIVDITDLDVVAWLKAEMRIMLDEEIARAVLVGDGREIDDADKINETNIRPIAYEDDFYAHKTIIAANVVGDSIVEAILRARPNYRGTGSPTLFCTEGLLTDLLLIKDKLGRRLYTSLDELAVTLRVAKIVPVPVMESLTTVGGDILAILVNLTDYTMGADKGGNISMFDDFDIDYNQYKYLMETRMSGALTLFKSALIVLRAAGTQVSPTVPTFVPAPGVVTIPAVTGVVYSQSVDGGPVVVATAGAQAAIGAGLSVEVSAAPAAGYYFPHNFDTDWMFTRAA